LLNTTQEFFFSELDNAPELLPVNLATTISIPLRGIKPQKVLVPGIYEFIRLHHTVRNAVQIGTHKLFVIQAQTKVMVIVYKVVVTPFVKVLEAHVARDHWRLTGILSGFEDEPSFVPSDLVVFVLVVDFVEPLPVFSHAVYHVRIGVHLHINLPELFSIHRIVGVEIVQIPQFLHCLSELIWLHLFFYYWYFLSILLVLYRLHVLVERYVL
jgi:hypothetical protein